MSVSPWGIGNVGNSYHSRTVAPYQGTSNSQYGGWLSSPTSPPYLSSRSGTASLGRRQGAAVSSHLSRYHDTLFKSDSLTTPGLGSTKDRLTDVRTRVHTPFHFERSESVENDSSNKPMANGLDTLSSPRGLSTLASEPSTTLSSNYSKVNGFSASPDILENRYPPASATGAAFRLQKSQTSLGFIPSPPSSQDTRTTSRPHPGFNFHHLKHDPHGYLTSSTQPTENHMVSPVQDTRLTTVTEKSDTNQYYQKLAHEQKSDDLQLSPRQGSDSILRKELGLTSSGDASRVSSYPTSSLKSITSSSKSPNMSSIEARHTTSSQAAESSYRNEDPHRRQPITWLYSSGNRPSGPGGLSGGLNNYQGLSDARHHDSTTKPDFSYMSPYSMQNGVSGNKDIVEKLTRSHTWDHDFRTDSHQMNHSSSDYGTNDWRRTSETSVMGSPRYEFTDTRSGYTSMERPVYVASPSGVNNKKSILKKISSYSGSSSGGFYNSSYHSLDIPHYGRSGEYLPPLLSNTSPSKPPGSPGKRVTFRV